MGVIQIHTSPHNLDEFRECATALRYARLVRCQVARNDVQLCLRNGGKRPKVSATAQVSHGIDHGCAIIGWLQQVGVAVGKHEFGSWTMAVATVAVAGHVDNIAAQSHQVSIFAGHVQRNRSYGEADLNHLFFVPRTIVMFFVLRTIVIVVRMCGRRTDHRACRNLGDVPTQRLVEFGARTQAPTLVRTAKHFSEQYLSVADTLRPIPECYVPVDVMQIILGITDQFGEERTVPIDLSVELWREPQGYGPQSVVVLSTHLRAARAFASSQMNLR